jgi:hypothetical protein
LQVRAWAKKVVEEQQRGREQDLREDAMEWERPDSAEEFRGWARNRYYQVNLPVKDACGRALEFEGDVRSSLLDAVERAYGTSS